MSELKEVLVPDIGDFNDVPVIEIFVEPGDRVAPEDPLLTLESDKATLDIPAPFAGTIRDLKVTVGSNVSEGSVLLSMEIEADSAPAPAEAAADDGPAPAQPEPPSAPESTPVPESTAAPEPTPVPESTAAPEPTPVPESTPAPEPTPVPESTPAAATATVSAATPAAAEYPIHPGASAPDPRVPAGHPLLDHAPPAAVPGQISHATPAVRYFARELGVEISKVNGTGRKGRILKSDVTAHIRKALADPAPATQTTPGAGIAPIPQVDFSKFGPIEEQKLSRIKKISGRHLQRAWLNVPHVSHHDEADVTDLEAFRQSLKDEAAMRDLRVTSLTFIIMALAKSMAAFPSFNASLSPDGESLILKHYFHVGIAVDTPNGLVVPVLRNVDQMGLFELAGAMAEISQLARQGKLKPDQMQGGCMSISSLGGIGGYAFTPIVNAPEVAILGVSRSRMQPLWNGSEFVPRLMLPLDLSYDHRVIDGAQAARFAAHLCAILGDVRRLLL